MLSSPVTTEGEHLKITMDQSKRPNWVKEQTLAKDFEVISARQTDPVKDFKLDPSGYYVLVKILWESEKLSVAICGSKHEIVKIFEGTRPRDIWTAIFDFEEKNHLRWFTRKDHAAYLGKELKKAEIALAMGITSYF